MPHSAGVLLGSINTVAIMIAGCVLFREQLSALHVVGMSWACRFRGDEHRMAGTRLRRAMICRDLKGYIGAFFTWMSLLQHAQIESALAASHLEVVSVVAPSRRVFAERVMATQLVGALTIIVGFVCVATA
jgi:multidrug transporter EmrE-like cation transporter